MSAIFRSIFFCFIDILFVRSVTINAFSSPTPPKKGASKQANKEANRQASKQANNQTSKQATRQTASK